MKKIQQYYFTYAVFAVLFVILLAILFLSVQVSKKTQELRPEASNATGQVLVDVVTSPNPVRAGQPATLTYRVNTQGLNVYGVQLKMTMLTSSTSTPQLTIISSSGLEFIAQQITAISGGYEVLFAVKPGSTNNNNDVGAPFSTNSLVPFAQLVFTPTQSGQITMNFDPSLSRSLVYNDISNDQLRTMSQITIPVSPALTNTPTIGASTPTHTPTRTPTRTPTVAIASPTATRTPTRTPTQTVVSPTHTPSRTPTLTLTQRASTPTHTPTHTPTIALNATATVSTNPSCHNRPFNRRADFNNDNTIDITDYTILTIEFMQNLSTYRADADCSGFVDITDYSILVSQFNP